MHTKSLSVPLQALTALLLAATSAGGTAVQKQIVRPSSAAPTIILPKQSLTADELAVIVNDADPQSVAIARYYQVKRHIPGENMIHVSFKPGEEVMLRSEFEAIKAMVDAETPKQVQAYALTWTVPYLVDCMSITTAFAMGYDPRFCASGCKLTRSSQYLDSASRAPFRDLGIRPTMSLAGKDLDEVKRLIDRGVSSDHTRPTGTGYLVETSDKSRNTRVPVFDILIKFMQGIVKLKHMRAEYIAHQRDVMFYFTGSADVPYLDTNTFRPGAIADHLTSAGGVLLGRSQMSSLRWLEAGATGSYGTVVEPCNFPQKFPNPGIVVSRYTRGESLIEAYWKSVAMPGQGIFIGEPLANPFGGYAMEFDDGGLKLRTQALAPGTYAVLSADSLVGPYRPMARGIRVGIGTLEFKLRPATSPVYRIVPESGG